MENSCWMGRKVIKVELTYEEIKDDVEELINSMIDHNEGFVVGVNRVIAENDYYMSDKRPADRDCHYISIGISTIKTNNINNLEESIKAEIRRSIENIEDGKYNKYFSEEDRKYIYDDILSIKESNLLK